VFENTAALYDLDVAGMARDDLSFYERYARRAGRLVLELGCGTGRVTIPLAAAGFQVTGVDISPSMLGILREKLDKLDSDTTQRIHPVRASMADFALDERFDLVIIPFRAFQALSDFTDAQRCLSAVRRHLSPGGTFIVDVFKPHVKSVREWMGEHVDWVRNIPETGDTITRTRIGERVDLKGQVLYSQIVYYMRDSSGAMRKLSDNLALRYYYLHQMQVLLSAAGFFIEEEYGYYDGRSIEHGPDEIFVCRAVA